MIEKKPQLHLAKPTGDLKADARMVADLYEAITGKKSTAEDLAAIEAELLAQDDEET